MIPKKNSYSSLLSIHHSSTQTVEKKKEEVSDALIFTGSTNKH